MRIAFIITCLGVGGAEKVVIGLADALSRRGHDVMIVYLKGNPILKPGNPSIRLAGLGLESAKDLHRVFFLLRAILNEFRPDIVHSHCFHANILSRLMRLNAFIPRLITTLHNSQEKGKFANLLYRFTNRLADISTNVSDEASAAYIEKKIFKPGRLITVHNGICTNEFCYSVTAANRIRDELGIDPAAKLMVMVGRLRMVKDYSNLLMALSRLKSDATRYELLIAGEGPLKGDLLSMTERLGLHDRVRFLGIRRDVPDLLSAADIFVLSSELEGFPLVVGEAMACECLVVATDCGGVKEFVGVAGLLAPPKNADELARQIGIALNLSDEERSCYGKAARKRVQQLFSLDTAVDKWLTIYYDLS